MHPRVSKNKRKKEKLRVFIIHAHCLLPKDRSIFTQLAGVHADLCPVKVHSCMRCGMRAWNRIYLFLASWYGDPRAQRMLFDGGQNGATRPDQESAKRSIAAALLPCSHSLGRLTASAGARSSWTIKVPFMKGLRSETHLFSSPLTGDLQKPPVHRGRSDSHGHLSGRLR